MLARAASADIRPTAGGCQVSGSRSRQWGKKGRAPQKIGATADKLDEQGTSEELLKLGNSLVVLDEHHRRWHPLRHHGRRRSKASRLPKTSNPVSEGAEVREDGWRYLEAQGSAGETKGTQPAKLSIPLTRSRSQPVAPSVSFHKKKDEDEEDGWRWQEMLGTASVATPQAVETAVEDGPLYERQMSTVEEDDQYCPDKAPKQLESSVLDVADLADSAKLVDDEDDDLEDGWRWRELQGMPSAPTRAAPQVRNHLASRHDRSSAEGDSEVEEGWRWKELDAIGQNTAESKEEPAQQASPLIAEGEESPTNSKLASNRPEPGDLVVLGSGVPHEFKSCPAIVTKVLEFHCTVVVLDEGWRVGVGECWPCFDDFYLESRALRLGARVVVEGLKGARTRRLNGFSGVVSLHPNEGHPTFIRKPSAPDRPQLTVCVSFDDPDAAGERSVLLEPRFLLPYDEAVEAVSKDLSSTLAALHLSQQAPVD